MTFLKEKHPGVSRSMAEPVTHPRVSWTQRQALLMLLGGTQTLIRRKDHPGFYDAFGQATRISYAARRGTVLALAARRLVDWTGGLDPQSRAVITELGVALMMPGADRR